MKKGGKFFLWEWTHIVDLEAQKLNTVKHEKIYV